MGLPARVHRPCEMLRRLRDADWTDFADHLADGAYLAVPTLWGVDLTRLDGTPVPALTDLAESPGYPVASGVMTAQKPTLPAPWHDFERKLAKLEPGSLKREVFLTELLQAVPNLQAYLSELRRYDANTLKDAGVSFTEQSKYLTDAGFPMKPTSVSNMARGVMSAKDMVRKGVAPKSA